MRLRPAFTACLTLLAFCITATRAAEDAPTSSNKKKVVFIAGGPSHGFGAHDHLAGMHLLAHKLREGMPGYDAVVSQGWPKDEKVFDGAGAVVIFADGGPAHLALKHIRALDKLSGKGVGIGCIHYACEVPEDEGGEWWLKWMGGYFETHWSVNPHWTATFTRFPDHPVARGLRPFSTHDEWYYNMRFREGMDGVTPILSAVPPDETRQKPDGPHSGNPEVRKGIGKSQPEHVLWVSENESGSRGFGTTGAHFHVNWAQDDWRKSVLNAIVWIAKGEVPANGVESRRPTVDEMLQNHDEKVPDNFDRDAMAKKIEEMNKPAEAPTK
jgi:hypothetical protein